MIKKEEAVPLKVMMESCKWTRMHLKYISTYRYTDDNLPDNANLSDNDNLPDNDN